jgi:hypothetical protein
MKLFDKLFFDSAVGLGDAFVMNAIVHEYAKKCNKLYYPAKGNLFETIDCLYQDYDNIEVWRFYNPLQEEIFIETYGLLKIKSPPLVGTEIHRVGCDPEWIHIHWPQQIYENFEIPFEKRYSNFRMPNYIYGCQELYNRLNPDNQPYILVHRNSSDHPNGIPLDIEKFRSDKGWAPLKIIEVGEGQTDNMMQYKMLIENAVEVHCIPSSFFNLVDSMVDKIKGQPFFHDIRKNSLMKVNSRWNGHRWHWINYKERY